MVGRYWRCVGFETALVVTCAEPVEVGGDKVESVRIKLILQLSFVQAVENCSDRQAVHQLHMQQAYQATPRSSICSWTLFTWRMRARTILRLACSPSGRSATDFSQNPERSLVNLKPMPCQCNAMQCHAMPCNAMQCHAVQCHATKHCCISVSRAHHDSVPATLSRSWLYNTVYHVQLAYMVDITY